MSQRSFQTIIARMVVDTEFRAHVRERGLQSLADDLTPLEQERLLQVASDRGMEATRLVHKDFRLSKLYIMLPLTRFLLGRKRMIREASAFWSVNPPVSHYFLQEAIDFCDHLLERLASGLRVKYLYEIVSYERAALELQRPRQHEEAARSQTINFNYDPMILFTQLSRQQRPRAVPPLRCTLVGTLDNDENVQWDILKSNS